MKNLLDSREFLIDGEGQGEASPNARLAPPQLVDFKCVARRFSAVPNNSL